jgi:hypothetical protein
VARLAVDCCTCREIRGGNAWPTDVVGVWQRWMHGSTPLSGQILFQRVALLCMVAQARIERAIHHIHRSLHRCCVVVQSRASSVERRRRTVAKRARDYREGGRSTVTRYSLLKDPAATSLCEGVATREKCFRLLYSVEHPNGCLGFTRNSALLTLLCMIWASLQIHDSKCTTRANLEWGMPRLQHETFVSPSFLSSLSVCRL